MEIVERMTDMQVFRFLFITIILIMLAIVVSWLIYKMNRTDKKTKMTKGEKMITAIPIIVVIVACIGTAIYSYIANSGYKDEYIQVKGKAEIEKYHEQKQLLGESNIIANIKTKDNQLIKIKMEDNQKLKEMNNEETVKKGDKVKITSNQKYQLKHHFNDSDNMYHLTKGSQLERAE